MGDIQLKNRRFTLTVGKNCLVKSLILNSTGEELLEAEEDIALFSVTQERPYNNEVKLAFMNKRTTYEGNRLRQEGDRLIVGFDTAPYEAAVDVKITPDYIAFTLAEFIVHPEDYPDLALTPPPSVEFRLAQLPVKHRERFGAWLNVCWDETAAVCLLATSSHARIDSQKRKRCRILTADAVKGIRLQGCGAALIVSTPDELLDCVDTVEKDYGLPRGVESRRSPLINASAYWSANVTPKNVDEHIAWAKKGGFKLMLLYYTCLFVSPHGYTTCGDYDYRPEYPNKEADVKAMLDKIHAAGITPGLHFLHTHIGCESRYVTPKADYRLHKTRPFTLARPLSAADTEVYVEQDPTGCVMDEHCRILQFGEELIFYTGYTTERPFRFTGCTRGHWGTLPAEHPRGLTGGLLDVSEFAKGISVYLDQESDIQDEVADKLAAAYNCGFRYVYFDGSEGVNAPFEFHVPNAQHRVYQKLSPAPLFCEGAAKAHFGWHMLSGANAFDIFPTSIFKEMILKHPAAEAPHMQNDFTRLNFGWWAFFPDTQPDTYEFGMSRAAAWNCPATMMENLELFRSNPRTEDILEVTSRWEEVRAKGLLTEVQKDSMKGEQEHFLLRNKAGDLELIPYNLVPEAAGGSAHLRAFSFERGGQSWAVYWDPAGDSTLTLPAGVARCHEEPDGPALTGTAADGTVGYPCGKRRYLVSDLPMAELIAALQKAKVE